MEIRLKKIGKVKATQFDKDFDGVYDYWKKRAEDEWKYFGDLKFIKDKLTDNNFAIIVMKKLLY